MASGESSGLSMPDVCKVADAYGIRTIRIKNNKELEQKMQGIFANDEMLLCEVNISENDTVSPRTKTFVREDGTLESSRLEHMWPWVEN